MLNFSRLAILKPALEVGTTQNMILDSVRKFCRTELINYSVLLETKILPDICTKSLEILDY